MLCCAWVQGTPLPNTLCVPPLKSSRKFLEGIQPGGCFNSVRYTGCAPYGGMKSAPREFCRANLDLCTATGTSRPSWVFISAANYRLGVASAVCACCYASGRRVFPLPRFERVKLASVVSFISNNSHSRPSSNQRNFHVSRIFKRHFFLANLETSALSNFFFIGECLFTGC